MPRTLYIVDPDRDSARFLSALLGAPDVKVASFSTAEEFQQQFEPTKAAGVLIDIDLAGLGGLQLLRQLRESSARIPLVLMAAYGSAHLAMEALQAGACDFLHKPFDAKLIRGMVDSVRSAMSSPRPEHSPDSLAANLSMETVRERFRRLTEREREVARLVSLGRSSKSIAAELELSKRTVDNHRARILEKLQLENFVQVSRTLLLLQQAS